MKRVLVVMALVAALPACRSMHGTSHRPTPETSSSASTETAATAPPPAEPNPPPSTGGENSPLSSDVVIPPCMPPEAKPKPRPKPKPKPALQEAPPQLPTAPAVNETPPGGVVDAQVKPLPVSVTSILGKRVEGPNGEDLGRVVDVLADASGRVRVAIIDFGGFLGVGNHRIAVDWPLLRFNPDRRDSPLVLSLNREQLKAAPEYKENPRPQALMEPSAASPASGLAPAAEPTTPVDNKK